MQSKNRWKLRDALRDDPRAFFFSACHERKALFVVEASGYEDK